MSVDTHMVQKPECQPSDRKQSKMAMISKFRSITLLVHLLPSALFLLPKKGQQHARSGEVVPLSMAVAGWGESTANAAKQSRLVASQKKEESPIQQGRHSTSESKDCHVRCWEYHLHFWPTTDPPMTILNIILFSNFKFRNPRIC